ncbi:MAG: prolyl oligopeptidase family serine peptidase [Oscillospiraceae bacterium]|jgi:poly(3-hydroxybutyrate) depolymerase|nr:prolyl oligopeptidase family serine peptidase [Oscillospiraceae bacterium]
MLEVKQFPADMSALEVDRADAKRCLISGLFEERVEVAGEKRRFYTYITPGLCSNQPCLVIAPPENMPVLDFLEKGFWLKFAQERRVFLHILEPKGGTYSLDGSDAAYMNMVYVEVQSRRFYVTMQDNIYAVGTGGGAAVAQQAAMEMASEWSGLATFGEMAPEVLQSFDRIHTGENTGKTELVVSGTKAQLPVWMCWEETSGDNAAVRDYWKGQNDAGEEPFSNRWADEVYFPSRVCKKSQINEEKIAQVRVTSGWTGRLTEEFFNAVWDFISLARRHRSFGKKALRWYEDPAAYGAELHTMELDGFTRRWYEYVPESVRNSKVPVPLVVCMHGRGGSAESFIDLSGMNRVAEERGFIVVFPEASVYQQRPGGLRNVLLWNGNYQGKPIDDVPFILSMIEAVKGKYAIDASRVYACGQSSGGMMTSALAIRAPEVFAAVAPWSAIRNPNFDGPPPEKIDPVVPYLFLFGEHDWLCVDREKGELEYHVAPDIAAFLRNLMKIYQLDGVPRRYACGEINYYVYPNAKGVPLLIVGTVKDMSHANYPRESWITYDEFLAKFSRRADGTLLYMGEEAL